MSFGHDNVGRKPKLVLASFLIYKLTSGVRVGVVANLHGVMSTAGSNLIYWTHFSDLRYHCKLTITKTIELLDG